MTQPKPPYARYRAEDTIDFSWVDLRESRPRTRARLKSDQTEPALIEIDEKGAVTFDSAKIEIDMYEGDEYADVRAESEAYWAIRDSQNEEG